jgi:hypothetical protein
MMRFVIIASPRTGSSHLVSLLGAHPQILCNGNVFHPKHVWVFWPDEDLPRTTRNELRQLRDSDPVALLDRVFAADYGRPHVGFKIFEGQNDAILQRLIADDTVRKIVLYRKNVLANYSSMVVARLTDKFNAAQAEQIGEAPKIKFSPRKFAKFQENYNAFYRKVIGRLNERKQLFHLINYDEINDPNLFAALINFIGADQTYDGRNAGQTKPHLKQNPSDICSRFSNPGKVRQFLADNGFLHWSHEGETSLDRFELATDLRTGEDDFDDQEDQPDAR